MKITTFDIATPQGNIHAKRWQVEAENIDNAENCPVVLLHDSLGSVDLWRDFPENLAIRFANQGQPRAVIAYDRLGFGQSDAREQLPSFDFIAEEATDYFPLIKKHLGIDDFIVIGHSVGGAMGVHIASTHADCQALVTMASQAFVEQKTIDGIMNAKTQFAQAGQIERLQKWHGDKANWVLSAWTDIWLADAFKTWLLDGVMNKVTCPVLAIHGENDEYGSTAFPEFISQSTDKGEMLIFSDCGHMPHKEQKQQTIDAIVKFLAEF